MTTGTTSDDSGSDPTVATAKKAATRRRKASQARSRATVDAIVEAGARLFERGSATTNSIARLAGVSIGSLYEYFPNKEAILESLVEGHMEQAVARLKREIATLPPAETSLSDGVRRLVEVMLELHADRPGLHRVFATRVMGLPAVRAKLLEIEGQMRDEIAAWLAAHPEVQVPSVPLAARVVVEGIDALVHRHVEDDEGIDEALFVDEVTRLWVGYLRGGPSPPASR